MGKKNGSVAVKLVHSITKIPTCNIIRCKVANIKLLLLSSVLCAHFLCPPPPLLSLLKVSRFFYQSEYCSPTLLRKWQIEFKSFACFSSSATTTFFFIFLFPFPPPQKKKTLVLAWQRHLQRWNYRTIVSFRVKIRSRC